MTTDSPSITNSRSSCERIRSPRRRSRAIGGVLAAGLLSACGGLGSSGGNGGQASQDDCTHVPTAVSSEKVDLLKALATDFAKSWEGQGCVSIKVIGWSRDRALQHLV